MRKTAWLAWSIVALAWTVGCSGSESSPASSSHGERVATIKAADGTVSETGVFVWEIYRDAAATTVVGVDARGRIRFEESVTITEHIGAKIAEVHISKPAVKEFRVQEDGTKETLIDSADSRLAPLLNHLQADASQSKPDQGIEYGACISCATNSTGCVASTAACATCPTNGLGCFACPVMVATCFAAGYYCGCCYYGTTNC